LRGRRLECPPPMSGPRKSEAWSGMGIGWAITSTLIGGIVTVGGLGYLLDRVLGTGTVFTAIGIVLGAASGIYIVYLRWGRGGE
jgi:F0F1-type ATP synthase assembly protein I